MGIKLKKKYVEKINLRWFLFQYKNIFLKNVKGDPTGQGSLNKNIVERISISIPHNLERQEKMLASYEKMKNKIEDIIEIKNKVSNLLKRELKHSGKLEEEEIGIIFNVDSGKRITEQEVYGNGGEIPVVTSQTTNEGITWYADKDWLNKKGKIVEENCITWSKEGYAGKMFYRDYPFFPIDVCGYLTIKKEYSNKIDLEWFYYTQQQRLYQYVYSKGNQGKLYQEPISRIKIKFPSNINYQKEIVKKYRQLYKINKKLKENLQELFLMKSRIIEI